MPRVAICFPAYGPIHPTVAVRLAGIVKHSQENGIPVGITAVIDKCYLDWARNECVAGALQHSPTHLFWLDSDVVPPADVISRLLTHNLDVVGGLYHLKFPPFLPVAFNMDDPTPIQVHPEHLQQVDVQGLGCCLIKASAYRAIEPPWHVLTPEFGEDFHFFRSLKSAGIKSHLDPTVRCAHIRSDLVWGSTPP